MGTMGERFEMRVDEDLMARVDLWRTRQGDVPSRAEAMRRLVESALARGSGNPVPFSDGEKLLVMMVRDIHKQVVKNPEIDVDFIAEMIWGGHYWAGSWKMPGLFNDEYISPRVVSIVGDVLTMWDFIERGYDKLSASDKDKVKEAMRYSKSAPRFPGFDGNNETEFVSVARFLVEHLDRFSRFKNHDFNSHMPSIQRYEKMLVVFKPMLRQKGVGIDNLTADQIIQVLNRDD